jgi:phosphonate transport system ATP-binding protein
MHDVKLALNYTDRVVGIKDGRIALDEPTRTLRAAELESIYGD